MVSIEVKEIVTFDFLNKGPFLYGGEERQNPVHSPCCCCSEAQLVLRLPWVQSSLANSWGPTSQKDLNVRIVHTGIVFLHRALQMFVSDAMYFSKQKLIKNKNFKKNKKPDESNCLVSKRSLFVFQLFLQLGRN